MPLMLTVSILQMLQQSYRNFTDMVYLHPAMQCSTLKNTAQQELFNIIKTPFGTDFLVYSLIQNATLLKCMLKAV